MERRCKTSVKLAAAGRKSDRGRGHRSLNIHRWLQIACLRGLLHGNSTCSYVSLGQIFANAQPGNGVWERVKSRPRCSCYDEEEESYNTKMEEAIAAGTRKWRRPYYVKYVVVLDSLDEDEEAGVNAYEPFWDGEDVSVLV